MSFVNKSITIFIIIIIIDTIYAVFNDSIINCDDNLFDTCFRDDINGLICDSNECTVNEFILNRYLFTSINISVINETIKSDININNIELNVPGQTDPVWLRFSISFEQNGLTLCTIGIREPGDCDFGNLTDVLNNQTLTQFSPFTVSMQLDIQNRHVWVYINNELLFQNDTDDLTRFLDQSCDYVLKQTSNDILIIHEINIGNQDVTISPTLAPSGDPTQSPTVSLPIIGTTALPEITTSVSPIEPTNEPTLEPTIANMNPTEAQKTTNKPSTGKGQGGLITGIVIGIILGISLMVICAYYIYQRRINDALYSQIHSGDHNTTDDEDELLIGDGQN